MADGAYDRAATYDAILARNPSARFIVPPCKGAVPGPTATISPTQRDLHVLAVDEHGRMNWQKASGYNTRSKVEAAISRMGSQSARVTHRRTSGKELRWRAPIFQVRSRL